MNTMNTMNIINNKAETIKIFSNGAELTIRDDNNKIKLQPLEKEKNEQTDQKSNMSNVTKKSQYKGFASSPKDSKPTVVYADRLEELLSSLQRKNETRVEVNDKYVTCNIGALSPKTNLYEDFHKFDVQSGKDITPLYLKLPHLKRSEFAKLTEELRKDGAKYNAFNKKWYITRENDLNKFANYLEFFDMKSNQKEAENGLESIDIIETEEKRHTYQEKNYTQEQIDVINRGIDGGLSNKQIQVFANPDFSSAQMEEIRFAIKDGLSDAQIASFASIDFKLWQMDFCRIGMQHGLTLETLQPVLVDDNKPWANKRNQLSTMIKKNGMKEQERISQNPENYLAWSEMSEEQNYNSIDGIINNKAFAPEKESKGILSKLEYKKESIKHTVEFGDAKQKNTNAIDQKKLQVFIQNNR